MLRVLIVEDDPMISEIYQKKFSREGHEVLTAVSGEQVLNLAKREKIDIILLDLIMPKMDGFEVIKNLRSGSYDPKIKIIVFSNMSQSEDREKALELGADGFILKSQYNPSELVAEVVRLSNQYVEQEKNEKRENGEGEKKENPNQKKRILMIEDEDIFIEMFGKKLEQEGLDVTFAKNGAWGIKEALRD
jgi:DNA-binding response OmpR family regulator